VNFTACSANLVSRYHNINASTQTFPGALPRCGLGWRFRCYPRFPSPLVNFVHSWSCLVWRPAAGLEDAMGVNAAGDDLGNIPGRENRF